jgi:hypothetical protein
VVFTAPLPFTLLPVAWTSRTRSGAMLSAHSSSERRARALRLIAAESSYF